PVVEMRAMRAHVADIQHPAVGDFILQIEVVLLYERYTKELRVGSSAQALGTCSIRDRGSSRCTVPSNYLHRAGKPSEDSRRGRHVEGVTKLIPNWARVGWVPRVVVCQQVRVHRVVENPVTGADHKLIAKRPPSQADPRPEVSPGGTVHQSLVGVEENTSCPTGIAGEDAGRGRQPARCGRRNSPAPDDTRFVIRLHYIARERAYRVVEKERTCVHQGGLCGPSVREEARDVGRVSIVFPAEAQVQRELSGQLDVVFGERGEFVGSLVVRIAIRLAKSVEVDEDAAPRRRRAGVSSTTGTREEVARVPENQAASPRQGPVVLYAVRLGAHANRMLSMVP